MFKKRHKTLKCHEKRRSTKKNKKAILPKQYSYGMWQYHQCTMLVG